jgi:hypothetical protein
MPVLKSSKLGKKDNGPARDLEGRSKLPMRRPSSTWFTRLLVLYDRRPRKVPSSAGLAV